MATAAARSTEPADHERLQKYLGSKEFLDRLDSKVDYENAAGVRLRVSRLVEALGRNPAPSARKVFAAVAVDKGFLAEDERIIALIQASAYVRPALPELVKFWDDHCQPDDGFTPTTVTALVDNGSVPASRCSRRSSPIPSTETATRSPGCAPGCSPTGTISPCSRHPRGC